MKGKSLLTARAQAAMRLGRAALVCFALILAGCRRSSEQRANPQPVGTPKTSSLIEALPQKPLPVCPTVLPLKIPSPTASRHHQIVLSWNASTSSAGPEDKSLGYCLYRSEKPITAKKLAGCRNCELINQNPIIGNGCVDVDVEDGQTYFYAALAIQAGKDPSWFSNKTRARIPRGLPTSRPSSSYPLCREPPPPKQAPNTPGLSDR
jgi:hypothetical protein